MTTEMGSVIAGRASVDALWVERTEQARAAPLRLGEPRMLGWIAVAATIALWEVVVAVAQLDRSICRDQQYFGCSY
jgi:hypothetical protein